MVIRGPQQDDGLDGSGGGVEIKSGATTDTMGIRQKEKAETSNAMYENTTLGALYRNTLFILIAEHPEY
jgi:hypothetical protein